MSQSALRTGRLKVVVLAAVLVLAAGTLTAQRPLPASEAALHYDRAMRSFAEARYEDAYKQYNRVFSAGDGALGVPALKGMIRSALRLSSFNIARQEAEALKAQATDEESLTLFGDALWGTGLFDEAEATYQAARQQYRDSARARFGVARSLATRGRLDEALTEALTAATASPGDPDILALLGELYERRFRYDDAMHVYEEYVKLLPSRVRGKTEAASIKIRLLRGFTGRTPVAIEGADRPHTVPFTMRNKKIVVAGLLNGKTKVEFVLDTGADRTAVTGATADRAGLRGLVDTFITGVGAPGVRRLAVGRADSLVIGGLTIHDFPISIRRSNMPGTQAWQNETFSPAALGLSVAVDYVRRELTIARELPIEPADFRLPMRVYRLPFVRGLVNDKFPASFIVDTGGEMLSISRDMATKLAMRPTRRIALKVWGAMGLDPDAFVLPGVDLDFDKIQYEKFAVAVLNLRAPSVLLGFQLGGILGYAFLNEYRVAMDFARGELRLRKARAFP